MKKLSEVKKNAIYKILSLKGEINNNGKLLSMGLVPGRELKLLDKDDDRLIIKLFREKIMIDTGLAKTVMVLSIERE